MPRQLLSKLSGLAILAANLVSYFEGFHRQSCRAVKLVQTSRGPSVGLQDGQEQSIAFEG
jgi:hypothetical protein